MRMARLRAFSPHESLASMAVLNKVLSVLHWPVAAFLLLGGFCATAVQAQNASDGVPYASLWQALSPGIELANYPRLQAVQRITSKRPDVRPEQILVWINAPQGRIDVPVAPDGQVRFPLREELRTDGTTVSSNQPRGSLSVSLSFEVVPPGNTVWSWTEFADAMTQARAALAALEGPSRGDDIVGIEFRMAGGEASLTVETPQSEELLLANPNGQIVLRWDERVPAAASRIVFSTPPQRALPYLQARPR